MTSFGVRARSACIVILFGVALLGCEREGIETHTVPKGVEKEPIPDFFQPGGTGAEHSHAPSTEPDQAVAASELDPTDWPWIVPEGWSHDPEPRRMRLATYLAKAGNTELEVAVTRFGGRVGGELANINRWRGQIGLGPIRPDQLDSEITRFASPGFEGYQTRIESGGSVMLAAGVYQESIDQTWFVRTTAPDQVSAGTIEQELFAMARSIAGIQGEE